MRRLIDHDLLTLLSRLVIGGIFIYASYYKIIEPAAFAKSIWFYHIVPGKWINLMALVLSWLELVIGLALIAGIAFRGAVLWANVLTIVFILAIGSAIYRGISIDCGCFTASKEARGDAWKSILFNIGMLVLTVQLLFSRSRAWMLNPRSAEH